MPTETIITETELAQRDKDMKEFEILSREEADAFNFAELFSSRHRTKKSRKVSGQRPGFVIQQSSLSREVK